MRINTQHDQTGNAYHSVMGAVKVRFIESSLMLKLRFAVGLKLFPSFS